MQEVNVFVSKLDKKIVKKIIYNIDNAEQTNDPKLFKNFKMIFGNLEPHTQEYR
jgi:hypothetical protein